MDYQNKFRETLNRKTEFGSAEEGGDYVSTTSYVEVAVFCKPYKSRVSGPANVFIHHPALAWWGNWVLTSLQSRERWRLIPAR